MPEFRMPSLGADMTEGTVLEWLVAPGDVVHRGDIVAVVDTTKSAVEVECFDDGVVASLDVDPGTKVPVGTVLAHLTDADGGTAVAGPPAAPDTHAGDAAEPDAAAAPAPAAPPTATRLPHRGGPGRISPLARRLADELGVDLATVHGTGLHGVIRAEDVRAAAASTPATGAASPPVAGHDAPARALDMRRSIAALMTRSNTEIPHYHLALTVDLHRTLEWVRERNLELSLAERLVPAACLLRATALAAREVPELNGHWVEDAFRPAEHVDLGLILSLRSGGLLVPAIAGAEELDAVAMMTRVRDLTRRARGGRLRGSDLDPPSLTVSNLGDQGVESVAGVIYPPQVALVGFGAVSERPWAVDGMLGVRPLVTVTLAADHRATDGAIGSRFLKALDRALQDPASTMEQKER
ncbi:dihydrolipoamide acetyltransferase family protein [uncultured Phycicoccus sp.]|uniref:dihydrolipoamide acetyltransferase family protein n=1 Tax=uncultured Phycicoccus sp. TaxID=661422 RepID=UPI0026143F47|nr:dihydrolipoamide acetyltransferase family protein [uncultured Phycicoccus sp.]